MERIPTGKFVRSMPFERKNKNPGTIFHGGHTYGGPPFSAKRKSLGYFLKEFDFDLMEKMFRADRS